MDVFYVQLSSGAVATIDMPSDATVLDVNMKVQDLDDRLLAREFGQRRRSYLNEHAIE